MASKCALGTKNLKEKADNLGPSKNPMNAFLIFCKRQKGCVRRKCLSLENREITRVLGDWWASLGHIDKSLYSSFAHQHKENFIKPHSRLKRLRMPGGKVRKQQFDTSQPGIVPGKLADESQLGGLSSLLKLSKEPSVEIKPPLPKPLKKRYRDEVYDIGPVVGPPAPLLPSPVSPPSAPEVPEPKVEENGDVNKSPVETSEEEEERLKVWRSHILEENVNTKRTRARACKGQRYREFMWTSYANRRRSNRWELNQDKEENIPIRRIKTANKTEKPHSKSTKTTKTVNETVKSIPEKSNDLINGSHSDHNEEKESLNIQITAEAPLIKRRKKKVTKSRVNSTSDSLISNPTKDNNDNLMSTDVEDIIDLNQNNDEVEMKNNYSGFVLLTPNDTTNNHDSIETTKNGLSQDESQKLENGLVGSRKRKARRQEIRRLPPGSTFKGVDVITENDLRKEN